MEGVGAVDQDAHELEPIVQHDDVGGRAGRERPELRPARDPRRDFARRAKRSFDRRTECDEIPAPIIETVLPARTLSARRAMPFSTSKSTPARV